MSAGATRSRRHGVRRIGRSLAAAIVTGVAVCAGGWLLPVPAVPGTLRSGPTGAPAVTGASAGPAVRLAWGAEHRFLLLGVRGRAGCPPPLLRITSTAPARDEVRLGPAPSACRGRRTWLVQRLPLPSELQRGQAVTVLVEGRRLRASAWARRG